MTKLKKQEYKWKAFPEVAPSLTTTKVNDEICFLLTGPLGDTYILTNSMLHTALEQSDRLKLLQLDKDIKIDKLKAASDLGAILLEWAMRNALLCTPVEELIIS